VLVGSSMGGPRRRGRGCPCPSPGAISLAPAFYMPGFEAHTPQDVSCPTVIVHGWRDDIVPVDNSIRWHGSIALRCTSSSRITAWKIRSRKSAACCGLS